MGLSFTQLSTYRRCPRQYEYCYVKKIPKGISEGEAFGAAVHSTLKKWGDLEMLQRNVRADSDERLAVSRQLTLFVEQRGATRQPLPATHLLALWHQCSPVDVYATRVEADAARMRGEALLRMFHAWWAERPRDVVAIERGFSINISPEGRLAVDDERLATETTRYPLPAHRFTVTGRFDRIERDAEGLHVIDFKTSAPRSQQDVDADLQLSIYALAVLEQFGSLPAVLSFLFLTEDGVVEVRTARSEGQVRDAMKQIALLHGRIEAKDYHPTPTAAICKRCPYRGICDVAAA